MGNTSMILLLSIAVITCLSFFVFQLRRQLSEMAVFNANAINTVEQELRKQLEARESQISELHNAFAQKRGELEAEVLRLRLAPPR